MTTEVKKSLRSAAGVLVCLAVLGIGVLLRDRMELAPSDESDKINLANLVASNTDLAELPETKFFQDIKELLKSKYVDPIGDETKLANGAVRGMVASLGDPNSLYMDADQFRVYGNVRAGKYEGIGADVILSTDKPQSKVQVGGEDQGDEEARLPKLVIASIVPGSAADKAGLKAGDWAEYVDEHWIPNSEAFDSFQALFEQAKTDKTKADEFLRVRKKLREDADKRILPIKARDRLMMGTVGVVKTTWVRGTHRIEANLERGEWVMPGFQVLGDNTIRLPFTEGSAQKLSKALDGKSEATIDLRNNPDGDFQSMLACLKAVAPSGTYGYLVTHKSEKPVPLSVSDGVEKRISLTLLVDKTTRGAAEIFATALSSRGIAKLIGGGTAGNPFVVRWYSLPDGAGYTLVTAEYRPNAPTGVVAASGAKEKEALDGSDRTLVRPDGKIGRQPVGPLIDGGKK